MHLYTQIYEFASSAGAFEGYVYHKNTADEVDIKALDIWAANLLEAYSLIPEEVLEKFQDNLDLTLNRAATSLEAILEKDNTIIKKIISMINKKIPSDPDNFQKEKWFEQ
ncbi:MAG: hypothetical protein PF690_12665 [Deltaproteobacteria bacterium]|jgi:hypothetical protein|nr:hypothetical protein [Deltaproteobacteria bacterium]